MTENLRIVLLIIGVIAIAALLVHGVWSSRKERSSFFSDRNAKRLKKRNNSDNRANIVDSFVADDLDIDDVSDVKVVSQNSYLSQINMDSNSNKKIDTDDIPVVVEDLYDGINGTANSKNASTHRSSQSNFGLNGVEASKSSVRIDTQLTQHATELTSLKIAEQEQAEISYGMNSVDTDTAKVSNSTFTDDSKIQDEHVIIFHVVGLNSGYLRGDLLLNSFLNAGLHYGDMNIFHKHIGSANTSVLFSVANMVNPGTFDPVRMSEFSTPGVTCFMVLPTVGQPTQNFKIMLQTIQRIADDVGGVVWDNERRLITPQKIEQYRAEIREWMETNSK